MMIASLWRRLPLALSGQVQHPLSTEIFSRALTAFVLLKLLWQWPIRADVLRIHELTLYRRGVFDALVQPAAFANEHPHGFSLIAVTFLLVHLLVKRNVITAAVFCWLTVVLVFINWPIGDGGDLVTVALSGWAFFMIPPDSQTFGVRRDIYVVVANVARRGAMLQFVFLYAASGVDKLKTAIWINGDAFAYMRSVGGIVNPHFPQIFATPFWDVAFAWSTIALEILFGILVWFRWWQPVVLFLAVIFHLGIWWMLDLRDFALVMIVSLMIFIRDDQYHRLFRPWLLSA